MQLKYQVTSIECLQLISGANPVADAKVYSINIFEFVITEIKSLKVDDKKISASKPTFSGPSQPQRKDSTGQKVESQTIVKLEDSAKLPAIAAASVAAAAAPISSQAPQSQRSKKTPPFSEYKQHRYALKHCSSSKTNRFQFSF